MNDTRRWQVPFLAGALGAGLFFAGMFIARASPGGPVRRALNFSGTLSGRTGVQVLTFRFRKGSAVVCAPNVSTTPEGTTGAFSVEIPLDTCPASLFDGSDVTVEVALGGNTVSPPQPINPVPYAVYAERVGTSECPNGYDRATDSTLPPGAILCRKGHDEVVRIGTGRTAFWMDRYVNTFWTSEDGATRIDAVDLHMDAYGTPTMPIVPLSRRGVLGSTVPGWLRANALCRLVGKRLPRFEESILAVQGTPGMREPGVVATSSVRPDECPGARGNTAYETGSAPLCQSRWGVDQLLWYWTTMPAFEGVYKTSTSNSSDTYSAGTLGLYAGGAHNPVVSAGSFALVRNGTAVNITAQTSGTALRCVIPQ